MGNDQKPTDHQRNLFGIPSLDDGKITLYASPQTSKRIDGMRDQIAGLTKADTIFITAEDYKATADAPNEGANFKSFLQKTMPEDLFDYTFGDRSDEEWAEMAERYKVPLASRLDFDSDGQADLGFVSLGRLNETKEEFLSGMAGGVPVKALPGSDQDYQDFTTLHESRHIGQPTGGKVPVISMEMDADDAALKGMTREGKPFSPELKEAVVLSRATGALIGSGTATDIMACSLETLKKYCAMPTHSTHLALTGHLNEGLPALTSAENQAEWKGMLQTKSAVNIMMGVIGLQKEFQELHENQDLTESEKYLRVADTVATMNNPLATAARGAEISSANVIGSKAVVDVLRDTPSMQNPGVASYLSRVDSFFDKYMPDHKTHPDYLKDQSTLKQMADALRMFPSSGEDADLKAAPMPALGYTSKP